MEADPSIMPKMKIIDAGAILRRLFSNPDDSLAVTGGEAMLSKLQDEDLSGMRPMYEDGHEL